MHETFGFGFRFNLNEVTLWKQKLYSWFPPWPLNSECFPWLSTSLPLPLAPYMHLSFYVKKNRSRSERSHHTTETFSLWHKFHIIWTVQPTDPQPEHRCSWKVVWLSLGPTSPNTQFYKEWNVFWHMPAAGHQSISIRIPAADSPASLLVTNLAQQPKICTVISPSEKNCCKARVSPN